WQAVANGHGHLTAGDRDEPRRVAAERERRADDFDRRIVRGVADERLRRAERERVGRTRGRHAETRVARAPDVLDCRGDAGRFDPDHFGTKRTRSPGLMSDGRSRAGSNMTSPVDPMSRQPPGDRYG